MRTRRLLGIAVLVGLLGSACSDDSDKLPPPKPSGEEEAAVVAAWEQYKQAVLKADGAAAAEVLSDDTIAYFDGLRQAAMDADRAALDAMPTADVLTVLVARYEFRAETLAPLDGRGFVDLAVRNGLISESTVATMAFSKATVTGDIARLDTENPQQALRRLDMRRDGGKWKVHFLPVLQFTSRALDRQAADAGKSRTELGLELLRRSRPDATEQVFQPLARR